MPVAVFIKDLAGRFVHVNRRWTPLFGFEAGEVVGKTNDELFPPGLADVFRADDHKVFESGATVHAEELVVQTDGPHTYRLLKIPLRDAEGRIDALCGVATDISERKEIEESIQASTTAAEHARDEAEAGRAAAERASAEIESWTRSVSQGLRGPLRAIDGFSQALLGDHAASLDPDGVDCIRRIRSGAQRMARLLEDLQTLSEVSCAELIVQRANLSSMAREITEDTSRREPQRRVAFRIQEGIIAEGDPRFFRVPAEVPHRERVEVHARKTGRADRLRRSRRGRRARLLRRGQRDRIRSGVLGQAFLPFQRLHPPGTSDGNGMGLATAAQVVSRHGGRIRAEGIVSRGTTCASPSARPCAPTSTRAGARAPVGLILPGVWEAFSSILTPPTLPPPRFVPRRARLPLSIVLPRDLRGPRGFASPPRARAYSRRADRAGSPMRIRRAV